MIKYRLTEQARQLKKDGICDCTPIRGTKYSAGMDLKACLDKPVDIRPYETVKILTGVQVFLGIEESEIDMYGYEADSYIEYTLKLAGFYLPRSSNKGLQLENTVGLLDCDYQGESFVKLYNKTEETITIQPGERLVQLVIMPVIMDDWVEVDSFDSSTERGENGDGSTGKH
jgi:dUTP pyrophosphatase